MKKFILTLGLSLFANNPATAWSPCPQGAAICQDGTVMRFPQELVYGLSRSGFISCDEVNDVEINASENLCANNGGLKEVVKGKRTWIFKVSENFAKNNVSTINEISDLTNKGIDWAAQTALMNIINKNDLGEYMPYIELLPEGYRPEILNNALEQYKNNNNQPLMISTSAA